MAIRERVKKNGKKSYQVKIILPNFKWATKTFHKKKDALKFENEMKYKLNKDSSLYVNISKKITVNEFWGQWSNETISKCSEGWKLSQSQMYRDYIKSVIGERIINSISPKDVYDIIEFKKTTRGYPPSQQLKMHVYNLINKIFSDAYEMYEYIEKNPVKKHYRPKLDNKESAHLSIQQIKKLIKHTTDKDFYLAICLQLYCGLRVGEVQALRWDDIDYKSRMLLLKSSYDRKLKKINNWLKTKETHQVVIPNELFRLLDASKPSNKKRYIVGNGDNIFSYHKYYKKIKKYCKELGVIKNVSTHTLRHSSPLIYLQNGASYEDIQYLLGHTSLNMTQRYIHDNDIRHESMLKISSKITILS